MIKQDKGGKWWLHFSDGRKEGPFPSHARVMARERQVNYFKYKNKHESMLNEGWFIKKAEKGVQTLWDTHKGTVKSEANKIVDDIVAKHTPAAKKQAKRLVLGLGGVTLAGSGAGSYIGTRAGNRKKKIKESDIMLFSFAIGVNSALRNKASNHLVQESIGGAIKKILGMNDTAAAVARIKNGSGVLPVSKLGKAAHKNKKTMDYIFNAYKGTKTLKNMQPFAFGKVQ